VSIALVTAREGNGHAHLYVEPLLCLVVCEQMQDKVTNVLQSLERQNSSLKR
jgi:hypothetical protein